MKTVELVLNDQTAQVRDKLSCAKAIKRAFGIDHNEAHAIVNKPYPVVIRCRQDQFADFIIFRIEEGVTNNRIACLCAKYIESGQLDYYDVTRN